MDDTTTDNGQDKPVTPSLEQAPESGDTLSADRGGSFPKTSRETLPSWLWHHIGMVLGIVITCLAVASVLFLAVAGFTAALVLLVVILFGVAMIIIGGRIRSK